eukprot:tig00021119_g18427.t1
MPPKSKGKRVKVSYFEDEESNSTGSVVASACLSSWDGALRIGGESHQHLLKVFTISPDNSDGLQAYSIHAYSISNGHAEVPAGTNVFIIFNGIGGGAITLRTHGVAFLYKDSKSDATAWTGNCGLKDPEDERSHSATLTAPNYIVFKSQRAQSTASISISVGDQTKELTIAVKTNLRNLGGNLSSDDRTAISATKWKTALFKVKAQALTPATPAASPRPSPAGASSSTPAPSTGTAPRRGRPTSRARAPLEEAADPTTAVKEHLGAAMEIAEQLPAGTPSVRRLTTPGSRGFVYTNREARKKITVTESALTDSSGDSESDLETPRGEDPFGRSMPPPRVPRDRSSSVAGPGAGSAFASSPAPTSLRGAGPGVGPAVAASPAACLVLGPAPLASPRLSPPRLARIPAQGRKKRGAEQGQGTEAGRVENDENSMPPTVMQAAVPAGLDEEAMAMTALAWKVEQAPGGPWARAGTAKSPKTARPALGLFPLGDATNRGTPAPPSPPTSHLPPSPLDVDAGAQLAQHFQFSAEFSAWPDV